MSKMIQLRNVPDDLHRLFKERAARAGMSLSDYLLSDLRKLAERPTLEELTERVRRLKPVVLPPGETPAEIIRRQRDAE